MPETLPLMTPEEVKDARARLGLTQTELARVLAISPATVRRYETATDYNSARPIHPTAARVIRWCLDGWRPPEWPKGKP